MTGAHSLTATYSGDATHLGSTSPAFTETVGKFPTTTTLAVSPNPADTGQAVALTATVTCSAGASGNLAFYNNGSPLGARSLVNGRANFPISSLAAGNYSLSASYGGDATNGSSTSPSVTLAVAPNSAAFGKQAASTASVVPAGATGTTAINGGTARFTAPTVTAGSQSLAAHHRGDSNNGPGASPAEAVTVSQVTLAVSPDPSTLSQATFSTPALAAGSHTRSTSLSSSPSSRSTAYNGDAVAATVAQGTTAASTTLAASPNPSYPGQPVMLSATVTPARATGAVTFKDGNTTLGTATLNNGSASLATSTLVLGSHSLTAAYSGDSNYGSGTSPVVLEVINQASAAVTLTASPNPASAGQQVNLTAAVTPSSATGTVTFKDGTATLGTATLSNGSAGFAISTLTVGSQSLTAAYSGDKNDSPGTSPALVEVVNQASAAVTLTASPNPANAGQQVNLTAAVTPSSATGTVTFKDNSTTLGTVAIGSGSASLAISTLAAGSHSLTAAYSGDGTNSPGTSLAVAEVIGQASGGVTLTASPNPANVGQQVSLTAAVIPSSATGAVTFKDGSTSLGTATINHGSASFAISSLTVGSHSLTAAYSGDGTNSPGTSLAVAEAINPATAGVTLTASPNPAAVGQQVTLTATVSPSSATGTITVYDSVTASSVGSTVTLSNGIATIFTSTLKQGTQLLQASYSGDASNAASQSKYLAEVINPAGTATATTTTLSVSPAASTPGQAVTLTAAVAPSAATGNVAFMDGSTTLGTAALGGGIAAFSTSSLAAGSHTLTASYPGNASFAASTSNSITETVGTGTACVAFPAGFVPFSSVSSVSKPDSAGDLAAVGSMSAANFTTYQGLPLPAAANQQFCGTVFLATAVPAIAYVPTAAERTGNFSPFAGLLTDPASGQPFPGGIIPTSRIPATLAWRIAAALQNSTTTLSVAPTASTLHQAVTLTAIVTPLSATGAVTFLDGSTSLGTAALVGGTATLTVATLASGTHSITASYGGDSNDGPSTSTAIAATVAPATPAVTHTVLTSSVATSTFGQAVTLTAAVTPSTATGTVTFLDGSATLGTAALSGGTATFKTSALAVGSHSLSASYGGDANDAASTSAKITQTVSAGTPVQIGSPTALPAAFAGHTLLPDVHRHGRRRTVHLVAGFRYAGTGHDRLRQQRHPLRDAEDSRHFHLDGTGAGQHRADCHDCTRLGGEPGRAADFHHGDPAGHGLGPTGPVADPRGLPLGVDRDLPAFVHAECGRLAGEFRQQRRAIRRRGYHVVRGDDSRQLYGPGGVAGGPTRHRGRRDHGSIEFPGHRRHRPGGAASHPRAEPDDRGAAAGAGHRAGLGENREYYVFGIPGGSGRQFDAARFEQREPGVHGSIGSPVERHANVRGFADRHCRSVVRPVQRQRSGERRCVHANDSLHVLRRHQRPGFGLGHADEFRGDIHSGFGDELRIFIRPADVAAIGILRPPSCPYRPPG